MRNARSRAILTALSLIVCLMFVPVDGRITCDCCIEPVACRFVAAPFDSTLEKALVKPGDQVRAGEVLARLDGREIRLRRASLTADLHQASKKRDSAQVTRNYAEQQIAQLDIERLSKEIELLDYRASNLDITSPVDGVITSGDLKRVEGVPLSLGQTLFEIAPLDKMVVEVAVPDHRLTRVAVDKPVYVRLDAFCGRTWSSRIARLHPRAEIRDSANVFIAEAEFDNGDGLLRPGMKGTAKIIGEPCSLGKLLFHDMFETLSKYLTW